MSSVTNFGYFAILNFLRDSYLNFSIKGSKEQVPNDLHKLISRKIRVAEKSSNFHTVWKFEESGEVLPYLVKKQFSKNKYHSADTISEWHTKFQSSKWQKNNCHFGMTILVIWKTRTEIGLWDVLLISLRVVHVWELTQCKPIASWIAKLLVCYQRCHITNFPSRCIPIPMINLKRKWVIFCQIAHFENCAYNCSI